MVPFGPCLTVPAGEGIPGAWITGGTEIDPAVFARASRLNAVSMDMTGGDGKSARSPHLRVDHTHHSHTNTRSRDFTYDHPRRAIFGRLPERRVFRRAPSSSSRTSSRRLISGKRASGSPRRSCRSARFCTSASSSAARYMGSGGPGCDRWPPAARLQELRPAVAVLPDRRGGPLRSGPSPLTGPRLSVHRLKGRPWLADLDGVWSELPLEALRVAGGQHGGCRRMLVLLLPLRVHDLITVVVVGEMV